MRSKIILKLLAFAMFLVGFCGTFLLAQSSSFSASQLSQLSSQQIKSQLSTLSPAEKSQLSTYMKNQPNVPDDSAEVNAFLGESAGDAPKKVTPPKLVSSSALSAVENIYLYSFDPDSYVVLSANALEKTKAQSDFARQFGYDIFSSDGASFSPSSLPVNDGYLLGPGDTLIINVWGKVEQRLETVIEKDGKIVFPQVGEIYLAGVKFGDVRGLLKQKLSKHFVNFDLNVSLGRLRSVRIFILGDAQVPGAYDVPAMSTVFNSLYRAGGPAKMGSLREIKLVRNGKTIATVDLYDYLLNGDRRSDRMVENNDTIFVSPIGNTTKVAGMVKRPAIYEIKNGTTLWDAIHLAGGFTAVAFFKRIQLVRIAEGEYRVIEDIYSKNLEDAKRALKLVKVRDGDYINVMPISQSLRNYVTLRGNVARPGDYDISKGMTLGKLIETSQGLVPGTYMKRVDIYRFSPEQTRELISLNLESPETMTFKMKEWDVVRFYSNQELEFKKTVAITGAVERPGNYTLYQNMKVLDLIFLAQLSPYAINNDIELHRSLDSGRNVTLHVDASAFLNNPSHPGNIALEPSDELYVKKPVDELKRNRIAISGQIRFPGTYVIRDGETLKDVIARAGGFTDKAFLKGVVYSREIPAQQVSNQYRILKNEEKRMIYDQGLLSDLPREDMLLANGIMASRNDALALLRTQVNKYQNRVIVDLYSKNATGLSVVLQDGDNIVVPSKPSTVQIIGGVQNPSLIFYESRMPLNYYISKVGGYSDFAYKRGVVIFRADGSVSRDYGLVEPGDVVYVPEKLSIPFSAWRVTRGILMGLKLVAESVASIVLLQAVTNGL